MVPRLRACRTAFVFLFLTSTLVPLSDSIAAPDSVVIGTLGKVESVFEFASATAALDVVVVSLADARVLHTVDALVLGDGDLASYTDLDAALVKSALDAAIPVVVVGYGEGLRVFAAAPGTVRPDDAASVRWYGHYRDARGTVSECYFMQDEDPPEMKSELMSAALANAPQLPLDALDEDLPPVESSPRALVSMLRWITSRPDETVLEGAWDSAWYARWEYAYLPDLFICTWDFTVSKLADIRPTRDYYAVDIRPHTEIVYYRADYSSQVGWFIQNRTETLDHDTYDVAGLRDSALLQYQPTGTVSGTTVNWTIGGSVASDAVGLNAEYGKSYNMSSVSTTDQSSLYNSISKWYTSYGGPDYFWYPADMDQPCSNARSSHYTEHAAIISVATDAEATATPLYGVKSSVNVQEKIARDYSFHLDWLLRLNWTRSTYTPTRTGTIDVYLNRPPTIEEYNPSNDIVSLDAGQSVTFNVTASDMDGTVPVYTWYLDGALQATGPSWTLVTEAADHGSHLVRVAAQDYFLEDEQIWSVNVQGDPTAVGDPPVPTVVELSQNYPNPFNPTTRVDFGMPRPGRLRIDVYDATGSRVRTLLDEQREAGTGYVDWTGTDDFGRAVSSGVYFLRIVAAGETVVRKAVLAK